MLDPKTMKLADPGTFRADVAQSTATVSIGIAAEALGQPRTDLNGLRLKLPGDPTVYLIDAGYRRAIPDPGTYLNLFADWNGIYEDIDVPSIPLGPPITQGAVLAKATDQATVYLVDNGVKRGISSADRFNQYHFAWQRIVVIPPVVLAFIASGWTI